MITTKNLTKKFNETLAVDRLTLEVDKGEVFGFVGPNGAGKTTTIRMLTSLVAPTSGSAIVNSYVIGEDDINIRRSVGLLTETPGMYVNLSAKYNLEIYANLYEVEEVQGQVDKYLHMLDLWDRRHDEVGTFSKGMRQKLAIARALLHEPRILFLDEPTAGLDPEAARLVRNFITELRQEGRTIFICTHNLDEADKLCDRIGVFKTHLLMVDTPHNLRSELFGKKVVFHLREINESITTIVQDLPFVKDTRIIDNKLLVTIDDPESNNPDIIRALVTAGADVQFVGEHAQAFFQRDAWLGYRLAPNSRVVASRKKGEEILYEVVYSIDAEGRRDTPTAHLQPDPQFMLFFGGSYTFGEGVNDDETMPAQVSQLAPKYRALA